MGVFGISAAIKLMINDLFLSHYDYMHAQNTEEIYNFPPQHSFISQLLSSLMSSRFVSRVKMFSRDRSSGEAAVLPCDTHS